MTVSRMWALGVLIIAIVVCIKVGYSFFNDHSDPYNGLIAILYMWIMPCVLALFISMLISWWLL